MDERKQANGETEAEPFDFLATQNTDADFIDVLLGVEREVLVAEGDEEAIAIHDAEATQIRNGTYEGEE